MSNNEYDDGFFSGMGFIIIIVLFAIVMPHIGIPVGGFILLVRKILKT